MSATSLVPIFVALGLILLGLCFVIYQLMKQQGRLLLRVDHLERHAGLDPEAALAAGATIGDASAGLTIGTQLSNFSLPDLTGQAVSLEQFRGKQVFLVNWSPQCGFCEMIAPDLARRQADFERRNVQLLLVSYGTAAANRRLAEQHGLRCPVLLQSAGSQSVEEFKSFGTPAAYLLDEQGRVARPLAVGAKEVPALAEKVAGRSKKRLVGERPLAESRIERQGLKAGTPAPPFHLPDINNRTVSLEEFRGRKVLLVFTDPHCGPCDEIAPHLVRLYEQHRDNGLEVVMVSRGELEENRRKAQAHGFQFPVVMQKRWHLSRKYGIFATPVAFLIDEQGVIAKDVAMGVEEILALAPKGAAAAKEA